MEKIHIEKALNEYGSKYGAAKSLGLNRSEFHKELIKHDISVAPNQGGKGSKKPRRDGYGKIPLSEILEGKHPTYSTNHLKNRLLEQKIKVNICETCGINDWLDKPLICQLDHINGISTDHRIDNLRMLCPNCHSQTPTFCRK